MKGIKCVWVGKLKTRHWQDAAEHYLAAVRRSMAVAEKTIKDAPGKLPPDKRRAVEGDSILGCLEKCDLVVALDHQGKTFSSPGLAAFLAPLLEDANRVPCFVVGGAWGLSDAVLARAEHRLSLSPMTFPHELARVVLLEQLYRAASILQGSPYHH